ncbi:hypothetical protein LCGC14_1930490 [marine sediment metagenome]|uniref:Uncharacterized protein n=1 Tax=marine sediment metagenome TaxID=412755 RepID=A0A0F9FN73_9ZZZZ
MSLYSDSFGNSKLMRPDQLNDRWSKLPAYLVRYIEMVEMRLDERSEKLRSIEDNDESLVYIDHHERPPRFLGQSDSVTFLLSSKGSRYQGSITVRLVEEDDDQFYVRVSHSGRGELSVRPQSSNVIKVHEVPHA